MQDFDEEMNLLSKEVQLIQKRSYHKQPYLVNGFNQQFDQSLKELVVEYGFDFDKIALHLYYQFPQYEQRINYKTVTFRWWQIQKGKLQEKRKKEMEQKNQLHKQKQDFKQENDDKLELFVDNLFPFFQKPMENASLSTISTQSYSKAMQKSQILTEEESQRFILYKPKFIIDTEYQLERYEVEDGWMSAEQKGENLSQLVIEKLLKKVVSNQFEYDEFGGFGVDQNAGNEEKKGKGKWWEQEDESEDDEDEKEQMIEQRGQAHAGAEIDKEVFEEQNKAKKKQIKQDLKIYELDEDWDEYESD